MDIRLRFLEPPNDRLPAEQPSFPPPRAPEKTIQAVVKKMHAAKSRKTIIKNDILAKISKDCMSTT